MLGVEGSDDVDETPEVAEKSQSREDGGDNIIACKSFHFDDLGALDANTRLSKYEMRKSDVM